MIRTIAKIAILSLMLLGLPLLGVVLGGLPVKRYLEFPPKTLYVTHAPFSWPVFFAYVFFVLLVLAPFLKRGFSAKNHDPNRAATRLFFPWWGWAGVILGIGFWILAWTRFPWFSQFQNHTFTPLWFSYILTMNALICRRRGGCPLLDHTVSYLLLFPASAVFWWFFEYLNRFVQNWYYVGPQMSPWGYFSYATLSFSTVLPAFTATREWVLSFSWPAKFKDFFRLAVPRPRGAAGLLLILSGLGLALMGIFPDYAFSLLWVSPLLILVSLKTLFGEAHVFSGVGKGDWSLPAASAVSALLCGFFWEMWNFFSQAKWIYQIPFVERFRVFEMPLIGYAGYLPFGVECAVVVEMVMAGRLAGRWSRAAD